MKIRLTFLVFFVAILHSFSQGVIRGKVSNPVNNQPISFVNILVLNTNLADSWDYRRILSFQAQISQKLDNSLRFGILRTGAVDVFNPLLLLGIGKFLEKRKFSRIIFEAVN